MPESALGQAIEQEGLGPGEADREEHGDAVPGRPCDLAGPDRPEGHEPLLVRRAGQDVQPGSPIAYTRLRPLMLSLEAMNTLPPATASGAPR